MNVAYHKEIIVLHKDHFCPWDDTDGKTCHLATYSEEEVNSPAIQSQPLKAKQFISFSDGKESTCKAGDPSSIPGSGRSPGEGKGYPLQYSGLENYMNCIVHGVTKRHDWASTHTYTEITLYSIWLIIVTFYYLPTGGSAGKGSACNVGDLGLIPRLGRSPGDWKGYPL